MSISGIFAIGLSGLTAQSASLENVSNNIANSQTTGFRRTRTDFSTLITGTGNTGVETPVGGTDTTTQTLFSEQGVITRTSSNSNLAIAGEGFFVVSDDNAGQLAQAQPRLFTRSGDFSLTNDGRLTNSAGFTLLGARSDNQVQTTTFSLGGLQPVTVDQSRTLGQATSRIDLNAVLSSASATGDQFNRILTVIDASGANRNLDIEFTQIAANQWTLNITEGVAVLSSGTVAFNLDGSLSQTNSNLPGEINLGGGEAILIDVANLQSAARRTSLAAISADGILNGTFTDIEISRDGRVISNFSNGLSEEIFRIPLASFTNTSALEAGARSTYRYQPDAGEISLTAALTGVSGAVESAALEASTVDIAQEFSTLIETQRAYAANSRILSIADELWSTLTQTAT